MSYPVMMAALVIFFTQPALALTLEEAVATGLKNNPEIQAFRLEERVAGGQMQKAKLPPFSNPTIEGGLSLKDRPSQEPGGKFHNNQISLSQSVEIAGQRGLRIDAATNNLERARFGIRDLERTLRADIRDAFAQALFLRDRAALVGEYFRIQEQLAGLVSTKFEAGDVAALEVNLSRVELARAQRDVIAASTEFRNALVSLKRLIGLPQDSTMTAEGDLPTGLPPLLDKQTLLSRISKRPDLKAAEAEARSAEAAEKLARREAIPNVTWSVFQTKDEGLYERGGTLGVTIPLFDRKQGERMEARAKLSQARIRQVAVTRTAEKEIEESYGAAASSVKELELFKQAILGRTLENLDLLQLAFKEGKISFYDVRVAQRETIDTRNSYLQALLTAQRAYNALERAIGGELR
jgi:outer membrane protein, heavy metal efflux system